MPDPMEELIKDALRSRDLTFVEEDDLRGEGLDFYLPDFGVHIEVKQFHTPRVADQMARAPNVIVAQGRIAVELLARLIKEARLNENDEKSA